MNAPLALLPLTAVALAIVACAPPKSVRTLASSTAPFVVATHGSVPAVERAFAAQATRTQEELALYDARRRTAERSVAGTELLWSLRQTPPDKRSTSLVQRIRRDDALLRNPPPIAGPSPLRRRSESGIGQITKVTELLKTVATSRGVDAEAAMKFGAETWKQLKALEADANATVDAQNDGDPQR